MTRPAGRLSGMLVIAVAAAILSAACSKGSDRADVEGQAGAWSSGEIVAQVASYDLVAGRRGRFIVGLLSADKSRLVAFGTVEMTFAYLASIHR